jgi:hypothetical protein
MHITGKWLAGQQVKARSNIHIIDAQGQMDTDLVVNEYVTTRR